MFTLLYPIALLQAAAPAGPDTQNSAPSNPAPSNPVSGNRVAGPCVQSDYAGFDFWVGEWDVFVTGGDIKTGVNYIEQVAGGCAIRETWVPLQGAGGTSLSFFNPRTSRWQQSWIGGDGSRVDFEGGLVDGQMVLTGYWDDLGGPGKDALVRVTYARIDETHVRQVGEASTDHGVSWQPFFDLTYRPRKPETP